MDKVKIAGELVRLAKELVAGDDGDVLDGVFRGLLKRYGSDGAQKSNGYCRFWPTEGTLGRVFVGKAWEGGDESGVKVTVAIFDDDFVPMSKRGDYQAEREFAPGQVREAVVWALKEVDKGVRRVL